MSRLASPLSPVALRAVRAQLEMVNDQAWEVRYLNGLVCVVDFLETHPMVETVQINSAMEASVVQWGGGVRWVMGSSPAPLFKSDLEALADRVFLECGSDQVLSCLFNQPLSLSVIDEAMASVFDADLMAYARQLSLERTIPEVSGSPPPCDAVWSPAMLRSVAQDLEAQPHHPDAGYVDFEPGYLKGLADVLEFLENHPDLATVQLASPNAAAGLVVVPMTPSPQPFEADLRALEERLEGYGRLVKGVLHSGQVNRADWLSNAGKDLGPRTLSRLRAAVLDPTFQPQPVASARPRM